MAITTDQALPVAAKTFMLELQQHFVSMVLSDRTLREYINPKQCEFTEPKMVPEYARHYAAQLIHLYYSYEVERISVRFPADWWEAFKERWFPKWARDRWPVKWTHRCMKKEIALTDFPINDYRHKVYIRDIGHIGSILDSY
jgi:nuclear transport factor 2 (NTF2) superfamily protein